MQALPSGDLVVADTLYHRLQVLSSEGEPRHTIGNYGRSTGQVVSCKGMACDREALYLTDYEKHRVQKLRLKDGALMGSVGNFGLSRRGTPQLKCPYGIALAAEKLFVADSFNHRVVVFDTSLRFLFTFGHEGKEPGELSYPRGVANLGAGEIVVASQGNHRLEVFDMAGEYVRSIGGGRGTEPGQFLEPMELKHLTMLTLLFPVSDSCSSWCWYMDATICIALQRLVCVMIV